MSSFLSKLRDFLPSVVFWLIFIFLVRGCFALVGPSESETIQKNFLNEFLNLDSGTWTAIASCNKDDFETDYIISDETTVSSKFLYSELLAKLKRKSEANQETIKLITGNKSQWLMEISKLDIDLTPRNIELLDSYLQNSVHYCSAASLILSDGRGEETIPSICVDIVSGCLVMLKNDFKNMQYPCEPVRGAVVGALLYDKRFNTN